MPSAIPISAWLSPPESRWACTANTGRIKKSPSMRRANSDASERLARNSNGDMQGASGLREKRVELAGGEHERAERRAGEAAVVDDAGEHRKCRDGDCRAEEENRFERARLPGEKPRHLNQPERERGADDEGHQHSREGHRKSAAHAAAEKLRIELHAHQEHVEPDAELREDVERLERFGWEQELLCPRPEQAKQRGPYKHARDHLADDLRLAAAPRHPADGPASRQDKEHLQEERDGKFG